MPISRQGMDQPFLEAHLQFAQQNRQRLWFGRKDRGKKLWWWVQRSAGVKKILSKKMRRRFKQVSVEQEMKIEGRQLVVVWS